MKSLLSFFFFLNFFFFYAWQKKKTSYNLLIALKESQFFEVSIDLNPINNVRIVLKIIKYIYFFS